MSVARVRQKILKSAWSHSKGLDFVDNLVKMTPF